MEEAKKKKKDKGGKAEVTALLEEIRAVTSPAKGNMLAMAEALAGEADSGGNNKLKIKEWIKAHEAAPPDVAVCELAFLRTDGKTMIVMGLRNAPLVRPFILDAFVQCGAEIRSDAPPPSPLEDELGGWLDALTKG